MATKKAEPQQMHRMRELSRKVMLAYVGAFGVISDEAGKLFERFVNRGEEMEKELRLRAKRNDKQVRHFAGQLKKEEKATVARANKAVKKAVHRVEHAAA